MKKLSIVALVISIISLIISIYVWTGGFSGAGTFIGKITPSATTPVATAPISPTPGSTTPGTVTQTQDETALKVDVSRSKTFELKTPSGATAFTLTVSPVTYGYGTDNETPILVGLKVTKIETTAAGKQALVSFSSINKPTEITANDDKWVDYLDALGLAAQQQLDIRAAQTEMRRFLPVVRAGEEADSTSWRRYLVFDYNYDSAPPPLIVDSSAPGLFAGSATSRLEQAVLTDMVREFLLIKFPA